MIRADSNGHICSAQGMIEHVKKLGSCVMGLEIGVSSGRNVAYFLQECYNIKMIEGVDPYLPFQDWDMFVDEELQGKIYKMMENYLEGYKDRFILHKMKSDDAISLFTDDYFDYIFVDGDHSYEATYKDCMNYYSKLRTGGLFMGHDYQLPDVQKAAYDFRGDLHITKEICFGNNNVWYWYK